MRAFSLRGHFRSRDKDGGRTIRSAIAENPMLYANFVALCFIVPEFLPIEVLHCGNRDFFTFLLLWPWPWLNDLHLAYELDPCSLEIYRMHKYEVPTSRLSKVIVWQRRTDRQTDTTKIIYHAASWVVKSSAFALYHCGILPKSV